MYILWSLIKEINIEFDYLHNIYNQRNWIGF